MKSTTLCFSIVSECVFVIKKEMSYPYIDMFDSKRNCKNGRETHRNWFPAQHDEALRTSHHEPRKFVTQYPLYFISLLDLDAQTDRIYRRLDEDAFIFVTGNG